jgi:hypothetical protein
MSAEALTLVLLLGIPPLLALLVIVARRTRPDRRPSEESEGEDGVKQGIVAFVIERVALALGRLLGS